MSWGLALFVVFVVVVSIGSWAWFAIKSIFGPYDNGDDCSTDNLERDHADR